MTQTIACPKCNHGFKLDESLAAPLLAATRLEFEQKLAQKDQAILAREAGLKQQMADVARAREAVETEVAQKLAAARAELSAHEAMKARVALDQELRDRDSALSEMRDVLEQRDIKLAEAQKQQAEFLKKSRELDDQKREVELTIQKKVEENLVSVYEKAKRSAEDDLKLKVSEKELQIASMQQQIEELRRRAEQGSQQLQGEVLELELEAVLSKQFTGDLMEPVAKGEFGGDVLHRVYNSGGKPCGAILWESKRTKHWSEGWLAKLRDDQRTAKADMALLVSQALPKGTDSFDLVEGVWVAHPRYAMPVAVILRQSLIELDASKTTRDGQETKMELVYQYLTGPRFRHRVEAIVEKFSDMQQDLDKERKVMTKLWAKREAQIQSVVAATAGMYGDLQGIAGRVMQEIPALDDLGSNDQGLSVEEV